MTSLIGVFGALPCATPRTVMSRSVTVPVTTLSSWHTGTKPMFSSAISFATLSRVSWGVAHLTSVFMISLTCMTRSFARHEVQGSDLEQPVAGDLELAVEEG